MWSSILIYIAISPGSLTPVAEALVDLLKQKSSLFDSFFRKPILFVMVINNHSQGLFGFPFSQITVQLLTSSLLTPDAYSAQKLC